jgi:hypothetical protein
LPLQEERQSAVDNGASYYNAETILAAVGESKGLSSTAFVGYMPARENELSVEIADGTKWSSSILSTQLASDCKNSGCILSTAFKHTGYGSGMRLTCSTFKFIRKGEDGKKEEVAFFDKDDVSSFICFVAYPTCFRKSNKMPFHFCLKGLLDYDTLLFYAPTCNNILPAENLKQDSRTELARPGEGKNSQQVRSKNRQNRLKQRSKMIKQSIAKIRCLQKDAGLHLCDAICEQSRAYCRKKCLTKEGLEEHMVKGGHAFPSTNARDFLIREAGKAVGENAD